MSNRPTLLHFQPTHGLTSFLNLRDNLTLNFFITQMCIRDRNYPVLGFCVCLRIRGNCSTVDGYTCVDCFLLRVQNLPGVGRTCCCYYYYYLGNPYCYYKTARYYWYGWGFSGYLHCDLGNNCFYYRGKMCIRDSRGF